MSEIFDFIEKKYLPFTFSCMLFFCLLGLCRPPQALAAGVVLTASPAGQTVTVGQQATYTININRDGFAWNVTLSAANLPAGVTASFSPNPTSGKSSTLTLKTSATTPIGIFNVSVKGSASGVTVNPITVKLETRAAAALSLSALPAVRNIVAGQSETFELVLNRQNYNGLVAFAAEDLPAGVRIEFKPETTDGNSAQVRLYSDGLPFLPADFNVRLRAAALDRPDVRAETVFHLRANCNMRWVAQFGVPDYFTRNPEFAKAVTYDAGGNIYVVGDTHVPDANGIYAGNFDAWIAKYSPTGGQLWLRSINFPQQDREDRATNVFLDGSGNIYVAGYRQSGSNSVNYNIFITRFDAALNQSTQIFDGGGEDGASGMALALDNNGNLVLTAVTDVRRSNYTNNGRTFTAASYDLRRYVFDGNFNLVGNPLLLADDESGNPRGLAVQGDDLIYTVGTVPNDPRFETDAWVEKFDLAGNTDYRRNFSIEDPEGPLSPVLDDEAQKIAVDSNGFAYVSGTTRYINGFNPSYDAAWLMKLETDGDRAWFRFLPGDTNGRVDKINFLAVDANLDVFAAGHRGDEMDLTRPPDFNSNAWLAKFSQTDGRNLLRVEFAVADKDIFEGFVLDNADNLFLAGTTVAFKNLNYGYEDALLMKFSLNASRLAPFITQLPNSVQRNSQFSIFGSFLASESVSFAGRALSFSRISAAELSVTAPYVSNSSTDFLRVAGGCYEAVSPSQLTVTP